MSWRSKFRTSKQEIQQILQSTAKPSSFRESNFPLGLIFQNWQKEIRISVCDAREKQ